MKALVALVTLMMASMGVAHAADALKIAVYGAGGNIGQRIVKEALSRGHHVTAIVREPARYTEKHERLKVVAGDVLDSAQVGKLVAGQDIVISAVGPGRAKTNVTLYKEAAESLVPALRKLGKKAPYLIAVGGAGSLEVAPGVLLVEKLPEAIRPDILGQKAALDYYRGVTDVKWTYFSPAGLIAPGERTGKFRLGGDQLVVDAKGESRISMEDYAIATINEAETREHSGKRFTIAY